jgi:hypothetical protein
VPGIVTMGMDRVRAELGVRCGYELRWCVCSAEQVGAPHLRRRWFCLAVRNDDAARGLVRSIAEQHPVVLEWSWADPPEPPRTVADSSTRRSRCASLGAGGPTPVAGPPRVNAVVPSAVRTAFLTLCGFAGPPPNGKPLEEGAQYPVNGCVLCDGTVWAWQPSLPTGRPWVSLRFDPKLYSNPGRRHLSKQRLPELTEPVTATRWSTPRHGGVYASNIMTRRSLCDLQTQVRFESGTPDDARGLQINAAFVEWLMGFPQGWTEPLDAAEPQPKKRKRATVQDA